MIDTNKYRGHTPTDAWRHADGSANYMPPMNNTADVELITDAPLLLEAYKRLRLVADELYLHIVGEPHMTLDELVAKMPWRNEE